MVFKKQLLILALGVVFLNNANDRRALEEELVKAQFFRKVGRTVAVGSVGVLAYTMYVCSAPGWCDTYRVPFMFTFAAGMAESMVRKSDIKVLKERLGRLARVELP